MKRLVRHSPAVIIAIVALVIAVTGTALGGPTRSTSSVTPAQAKKIAKSVADAEIARLAPTLSVKSAQTAVSATSASAPAMFAQVTGAGAVTGNSQGITQANISHPRAGIYCFSGLPNTPKGGISIIDAFPPGGQGANITQVGIGSFGLCPTAQAVVATATPINGFGEDDPFFVVFWS